VSRIDLVKSYFDFNNTNKKVAIDDLFHRIKIPDSYPEYEIEDIRPVITPIPPQDYRKIKKNNLRLPRCCICGSYSPSKFATYQLQCVSKVERYCSECCVKAFGRDQ
jgi:hypothetical protein